MEKNETIQVHGITYVPTWAILDVTAAQWRIFGPYASKEEAEAEAAFFDYASVITIWSKQK